MTAVDAPFSLLFVATAGDALYVAGIVKELEDADVPHTMLWERIGGRWQRYVWKNRTYALAAYATQTEACGVYLGYEGTLKVRGQVSGSREEKLELGDDAPSSLRSVSCIRVVGGELVVCGMRRMVYARALEAREWSRRDEGVRLALSDSTIAGFSSIDGDARGDWYAVGLGGGAWRRRDGQWSRLDAPTSARLDAVRCLPGGEVAFGGEQGALWLLKGDEWVAVRHPHRDERFTAIECWGEHRFVLSDRGDCYAWPASGEPTLTSWSAEGLKSISAIWSSPDRAWFVGGTRVVSLGHDGWRDDSPPAELLKA